MLQRGTDAVNWMRRRPFFGAMVSIASPGGSSARAHPSRTERRGFLDGTGILMVYLCFLS